MQKITSFALILNGIAVLSSCNITHRQQAFYVSPFNGSSEGYHTLPMHTDTVRTATYGRVSGFGGGANDLGTDHFAGGNVSVYVAQHGKWWQAYYGLDGTLGSYTLGTWKDRYSNFNLASPPWTLGINDDAAYLAPANANQLNTYRGSYYYGGAGFSGGFNGVIPMGQGEWRFLGIETALHQEFGDYRDFRRKLPDSLAGYIVRNPFFATLGLTTEWILRTRTGDFGFRLAGGWVLGAPYHPTGIYDTIAGHRLNYSNYGVFTAHYTWGRYTVYYQGETATKGTSYQLGFIYRFGSPRVPAKERRYRQGPRHPAAPPRPRLPFGL